MKLKTTTTMMVVGLGLAALGWAQVAAIRLEARLAGSGNDKGKAKWQTRDSSRGEMQAQLEVEGENLMPNSTYTITVGSNLPWSADTDAFGDFSLRQVYRSAARPTIAPGSSVVVADDNGNTVLLGTLRAR